ncbi:serine/threonine-protein kinase [Ideonella sp.]|uniref:serine/threonine-protein kinase n=1 Tax=Ideonella sp. TaxID=1929293 RepID=UPI0035AF5723
MDIAGYPLVRTFAHGALGELHLATDPDTGSPLAIKTVRLHGGELTRERFLRESQAAERLRHPSIVRCVGSGIEGRGESAVGWIAMEWVAGTDLSRYASPLRLLPEPLVLELMAQAAEGLAHAHGQGVVHRDIKPANLLFNPTRGTLKITDFGCAHLSDAERSRSGVLAGTPVYMAPEQLSGAPVDGRCDLYALGVVLFELLTGHLPFEAGSMGELTAAISSAPPPAVSALRPDLPAALDHLVRRLLAKAPLDRHADGQQLAAELRQLAATLPAASSAASISTGERQPGAAGTMVSPSRTAARPS